MAKAERPRAVLEHKNKHWVEPECSESRKGGVDRVDRQLWQDATHTIQEELGSGPWLKNDRASFSKTSSLEI